MPKGYREPLDIQREPGSEDATYTVERNWILKTQAGTRCANVHWEIFFESRSHERARREAVQSLAMRKAVTMWEQRWGPLDWDLAQFVVTHNTLQVVVELKVEPE